MSILPDTALFYRSTPQQRIPYIVHSLSLLLMTPTNVELWMHLRTDWTDLHSEYLKDPEDMGRVAEEE